MPRLFFALLLFLVSTPSLAQEREEPSFATALSEAKALGRIHSLLIAQDGEILVEEHYAGPGPSQPANVKSISKTLLSALVGIAVDRGLLEGPDQPIAPLLEDRLPADPDPRLAEITLGHLLSMQSGLERTSGVNYGAWVTSEDWIGYVLSRRFVDDPGGAMLYSTGNSHLLSAILTRESGETTHTLMRDWLGTPLDVVVPQWPRDPEGIYFGGNDMLFSPRALLRFAELYRNGGELGGERILSRDWIEASWQPRTRSRFTGHDYGYGWFIIESAGYRVYYGWGYGGQLVYVVPELAASIVITSDPTSPSGRDGYARQLHDLLRREVLPVLERDPIGSTQSDR